MSKMSELSTAVSDLERCSEVLLATVKALKELFSTQEEAQAEPDVITQEDTKPVTIDEVRSKLVKKVSEGKSEAVQALLAKYGAKRLSAVDPERLAALKQEAEVL